MATNFETNQDIEKLLERIQLALSHSKVMVRDAKPASIPIKLIRKTEYLSVSLESLRELMRIKESRE